MSFEHFLDNHRPNPRRAALLTFAGAIAISGTALMLLAGWVAGKLSIARVEAPTMDYVLLSLTVDEPLPPPPPPPPPPGGEEIEEVEKDDDPPDDEDLEEPPEQIPNEIPAKKPASTQSVGIPGGQEGGKIGGIPGGIPNSPGIPIPGKPIATRPIPQQQTTMKKPLAAVMSRAVYSPDPSAKRLQQTRAARFDKRDGKNVTSFCIDTNGRTVDVRTKVPFPGDPEVDKIIRETIKSWRFKAFELGSRKVKTCTERVFMLRFK